MQDGQQFDVVVVGGGMSGLCAGMRAAELGARTLVLEKSDAPGGSWQFSGGVLWTARTFADLEKVMPNGDPELGRLLTDKYDAAIGWLGGHGVELGPKFSPLLGFGHGYRLPGPKEMITVAVRRFAELGGTLWVNASASQLLEEDGHIAGVQVRRAGRLEPIRAHSVVLCSGGFAANTELLTTYIGRWADRLTPRTHPGNTGDGYKMALDKGAATSRSLANFYGHLVPALPARVTPEYFREATFYGSIHGIVVNLNGDRFTDESVYDANTALALAQQTQARGALLFDGATEQYEREDAGTARPGPSLREKLELARSIGGDVAECGTLNELLDTVASWGVYREGLEATVRGFNEATAAGKAAYLPVGRKKNAHLMAKAPFYAASVSAGITFTMGGLKADDQARVLDRSGEPMPGLFAAGADIGGVFYDRYAGGGAWALVSAIQAAESAVAGSKA